MVDVYFRPTDSLLKADKYARLSILQEYVFLSFSDIRLTYLLLYI